MRRNDSEDVQMGTSDGLNIFNIIFERVLRCCFKSDIITFFTCVCMRKNTDP